MSDQHGSSTDIDGSLNNQSPSSVQHDHAFIMFTVSFQEYWYDYSVDSTFYEDGRSQELHYGVV